jgi:hypothetical protein
MKLWIAGARATSSHGEDTFIFGAFATEKEARDYATKRTYQHGVSLLYECELGKPESGGLRDSWDMSAAE